GCERRQIGRPEEVGLVRVEEVHPQEEGLPRALLPAVEPREDPVRRPRRRPLPDHEERWFVLAPEIVVVGVEALVEAVAAGGDGRGNESTTAGGPPAGGPRAGDGPRAAGGGCRVSPAPGRGGG